MFPVTHLLVFCPLLAACSTTETEVFMLPGCKYVEDGQLFDSFFRTTCNLDQCTTGSGPCRDSDRRCCCRAIATEPIDVDCEAGSLSSGAGVSTNETHCACTVCDDIEVVVSILVREPGEDGAIIPGAQVVNKATGELLGLTYVNGEMTFRTLAGERSISVIVLAANYIPRETKIELVATRSAIKVVVALLRRHPILVSPEDSGYTFRVGDHVYITVPIDGFRRNGSLYDDLVMFNGVYMNADDDGFLDMVDSDQQIIDKNYFSLSFFTYLSFSDPEGNSLVALSMKYFLEASVPRESSFLTVYDHGTDQWVNLGGFKQTSVAQVEKRQNRVSITFVQLNVALDGQLIFHASLTNVNCWLQMRAFSDADGTPSQGPIGIVIQTGINPDGSGFTFRFGTNTGSLQFSSDGLVSNAICLPLACDGFDRGTVESALLVNIASPQTPIDFPEGTFNVSELGAPTRIGPFFSFLEVTTATPTRPRPFYPNVDECIAEGTIPNGVADSRSFFSFQALDLQTIPPGESCFVKIRVIECVRNSDNRLIFFDQNGIRSEFFLGNETLIDEYFSADHFLDNDCNEGSRIACIGYECNSIFQIAVRDHNVVEFCNVSMLAPIAQSQFVMQPAVPQTVHLSTGQLAEQDYNNPDLGLYYDPSPAVALDRCLDPLGLSATPNEISIEGYAASFDCVGESTADI